jgi:hypothetical protein
MRDYLLDIVKHTLPLGAFGHLRVDADGSTTEISATETEKQLVLKAKTHAPIPEFDGTFGIPNLALLNTLLNIPEYNEEATIKLLTKTVDGSEIPFNIDFKNAAGDFQNDFRLMSKPVIESLEPKLSLNAKFPVEFVPSANSVKRLKYQVSANPDEKNVQFDVSNGEVKATVGDASSHSGNFVFQDGIDEKASYSFASPSLFVLGALNMDGQAKIYMGDLGLKITVDSGLVSYDYIMPMVTK